METLEIDAGSPVESLHNASGENTLDEDIQVQLSTPPHSVRFTSHPRNVEASQIRQSVKLLPTCGKKRCFWCYQEGLETDPSQVSPEVGD